MICLYFGSFNPMHQAHMALARYAHDRLGFDEVWLVLSPLNPQKDAKDQLPYSIRREIITEAITKYPYIKLIDIELYLPRPLYSLRTIQALKLLRPTEQFGLLIGSDNLLSFHTWHRWHDILSLVDLYVYPRIGYLLADAPNTIPHIACTDAPQTDIAASAIRKALREGEDVSYLLASPPSWSLLSAYFRADP